MTTINPLRPTATAPRPYAFPDFERRELSSGMPVWLVPLPDRSLVNVHLLVDAGAASEDEAHAGVAALTAQLLVTGTRRLDAAAFAEATERLGIEVSSESSWDSARAAFQALPEHVDEGLALLAEMVREPRLDPDEFARLRDERLADILQARADPGRLADEMFLRTLYADDVPYGRISAGSPESVEPLTVDDVRTFQAAAWGSRAANLIVAGGFDAEQVMAAAEAAFGGWRGNATPHRDIEVRPAGARRVGHRRSARIGPERAAGRADRHSTAVTPTTFPPSSWQPSSAASSAVASTSVCARSSATRTARMHRSTRAARRDPSSRAPPSRPM